MAAAGGRIAVFIAGTLRALFIVALLIFAADRAEAAFASHTPPKAALKVTVDDSGLAHLVPGATGRTTYTISNPNTAPARLVDTDAGGVLAAFAVDSTHPMCDPRWFSFIPQEGEATIYGAHRSATYAGSVSMKDAAVDQSGCEGAIVTITLSVQTESL